MIEKEKLADKIIEILTDDSFTKQIEVESKRLLGFGATKKQVKYFQAGFVGAILYIKDNIK